VFCYIKDIKGYWQIKPYQFGTLLLGSEWGEVFIYSK